MERDAFWENVGHALVGLVRLRIAELAGSSEEEVTHLACDSANLTALKADAFQFQQRAQKPTAVLSALATALALGARQEGGITHRGVHACLEQHPGCPR